VLESSETIDLLLSDIVMPNGVSGLDLAQEARRLRQDIKIVLISGYLRGSDSRMAALPSGLALLEKPFSQEALLKTIASALGGEARSPPAE
ncbi:MAG: response regulator, partial [Terriglobia bacterium]